VNPTPFFSGTGRGLATLGSGQSLSLAAGLHPVEAYPQPGFVFTSWSVVGSGLTVAAPQFPITWLLVDGSAASSKLVAHYTASNLNATIYLVVEGVGSAKLGTLGVTNTVAGGSNYVVGVYTVGSYSLEVTPGTGTFQSIIEYYFPVIAMMNFSADTRVTLENGTSEFLIVFVPGATVKVLASPPSGGTLEFGAASGYEAISSGTTLDLPSGDYAFVAAPASHHSFTGWSTNHPGNATFLTSPSSPWVEVSVNGPARLTANFVTVAGQDKVSFTTTAGSGGAISFNFGTAHLSGGWVKVAPGQYFVTTTASVGWGFSGWSVGGGVSLVLTGPGVAVVSVTAPGTLTASFAPEQFLVSFVAYSHALHVSRAYAMVGTTQLLTGETMELTYGMHMLVLHLGGGRQVTWESSANIGIPTGTHTLTLSFFVSGAGTIYAVMR